MENKTLLKIAEDFGSPIYVYDSEKIVSQYKRLNKAFNKVKRVKVNYAMKALSNISILKLLNSLGSGLDTISSTKVFHSLQEPHLPIHCG